MNNATKNLLGTEIRKCENGGHLDLCLTWNEKGTHFRQIQAATFRIAASLCECSESFRWCIDPHADAGSLGRGVLVTYIRIEFCEGNAAEMELAEILVRQVIAGIKG